MAAQYFENVLFITFFLNKYLLWTGSKSRVFDYESINITGIKHRVS